MWGKPFPQGPAAGGQAGGHGGTGNTGDETRLPVPGLPAGGEGWVLPKDIWCNVPGKCGKGTLVVGSVRFGFSGDNSQDCTEQVAAPCDPLSGKC